MVCHLHATASTNYVSFALWLALFQLGLQLLLYTISSQLASTIIAAYPHILAHRLHGWLVLAVLYTFCRSLYLPSSLPKFLHVTSDKLEVQR